MKKLNILHQIYICLIKAMPKYTVEKLCATPCLPYYFRKCKTIVTSNKLTVLCMTLSISDINAGSIHWGSRWVQTSLKRNVFISETNLVLVSEKKIRLKSATLDVCLFFKLSVQELLLCERWEYFGIQTGLWLTWWLEQIEFMKLQNKPK